MPIRDVDSQQTNVAVQATESISTNPSTNPKYSEEWFESSVQKINCVDPPEGACGKVIKLSEHNINCWHVPLTCAGRTTEFLIDTGSTRSIITLKYYKDIPNAPVLTPTTWRLTDAQENDLPIVGQCHLLVTIGNRRFAAPFFVVDNNEGPSDALNLIGSDFQAQSGMVLNLRRGTLRWEDHLDQAPIVLNRVTTNVDVSFLRAVEPIKIKSQTIQAVEVIIEHDKRTHFHQQPVIVETEQRCFEESGLIVQNGVVVPQGGRFTIYVANPNGHDCELQADAITGMATVADAVLEMPKTEEEFEKTYGPILSTSSDFPVHNTAPVTHIRTVQPPTPGCKGKVLSCPAYQRIVNCKNDASEQGGLEDTSVLFAPMDVKTEAPSGQLPDHVQQLYENTPIEENQDPHLIKHLLEECLVLFQSPDAKLTSDTNTEHTISFKDPNQEPIKQQVRRLAHGLRKPVEQECKKMLKHDYIRPSSSAWASPIVPVKKKDGTLRFCIDYRKLNAVTKKDSYPLPRIDVLLETLKGAKYFCCLDLYSGYWQIKVAKQDREKTAFVTHCGLYEFNVMPFGLTNAPATFQRYMDDVLQDLNGDICQVYLDDCIVFANTWEDMIVNLRRVFQRFMEHGLRLKASKCKLFQKECKFLGHVISEHGISTDPDKTASVSNFSIPRNIKDVRAFLGLTGYYRKFIPDYADKAEPLLLTLRKDIIFYWGEEQQKGFTQLKAALVSAPILAFPDYDLPYIVDTDASEVAVGGVLSQVQEGHERVIAYASHTLNRAQRNYCVTLRELFAIKYCLTEKWHYYLVMKEFTLRTDHSALLWLFKSHKERPLYDRWFHSLSEFEGYMTVKHRAGIKHGNADALSRLKQTCDSDTCPDCTLKPSQTPIIGEQFSSNDEESSSSDEDSYTPKTHVTFATPEVASVRMVMTRSRSKVPTKLKSIMKKGKPVKKGMAKLGVKTRSQSQKYTTPKSVYDTDTQYASASNAEATPMDQTEQVVPSTVATPIGDSNTQAGTSQHCTVAPPQPAAASGTEVHHPVAMDTNEPDNTVPMETVATHSLPPRYTVASPNVVMTRHRAKESQLPDSGELNDPLSIELFKDQLIAEGPPKRPQFTIPSPNVVMTRHRAKESQLPDSGELNDRLSIELFKDQLIAEGPPKRPQFTIPSPNVVMTRRRAKDSLLPDSGELNTPLSVELFKDQLIAEGPPRTPQFLSTHSPKNQQQSDGICDTPPANSPCNSPSLDQSLDDIAPIMDQLISTSPPPDVSTASSTQSSPSATRSKATQLSSLPTNHKPHTTDAQYKAALDQLLDQLDNIEHLRKEKQFTHRKTIPTCDQLNSTLPWDPIPSSPNTENNSSEDENVSAIIPSFTIDELRQEQASDPAIVAMLRLINTYHFKPLYEELKSELTEVRAMCQIWDEFFTYNGLLYRNSKYGKVFVLPRKLRQLVMSELHAGYTSGHPGITRMTKLVKQRFYWVGMKKDIELWIKCCFKCIIAKRGPGRGKAPMQPELSGAPFDRCSFDIIGPLPETERGNRFILTVVDYFSKWAEGYALPEHSAITVAWTLCTEWIARFGTPLRFHCDKAPEFESVVLAQVFQMLGIKKTRTTAYRPQSNGLCERTNQTIENILKATVNGHCNDWDLHLPYALMSYRATPQSSTGLSPNMIVFGKENPMPIDLVFRVKNEPSPWINPDGSSCFCSYTEWLRDAMSECYVTARDTMQIAANRQKRYYDRDCKPRSFEVGDWVMYYHKPTALLTLNSGWTGPFVVIRKFNSVDYEITADPSSPIISTHIDYLRDCPPNEGKPNWITNQPNKGPPVFEHKKVQTKPVQFAQETSKRGRKRQVKPMDPPPKAAKRKRSVSRVDPAKGPKKAKKAADTGKNKGSVPKPANKIPFNRNGSAVTELAKGPKKVKKAPDKGKIQGSRQKAAQDFLSNRVAPSGNFRGFQTRKARKKGLT